MERFTRLLKVPNVKATHDPVVQPIYQTSMFRMPDHRVAAATEHAVHPDSYYTRWGNPTVQYLENQLSTLLGCNASLVFPSGMSAITTTLLSMVGPRDLVAVSSGLYGDTTRFFVEELRHWGVEVALFDPSRPDTLPALVRRGAKLVYYESISNPELRIADFDAIHAACDSHDVVTVCDCTFSPPGVLSEKLRPADLVIHSLTKYIGGHCAVFGGSVSGWQSLIDRIWHKQALLGACMDPQAAWQLSQGLKTLELRIARQNATALQLAQRLAAHRAVEQVHYPLLDTRPGARAAANKYLVGGGGVIAVALKGGEPAAVRLVEQTRVFGLSVSLGGVASCIEHAQSMSHSMLAALDERALSGVAAPADNLVRLSVGLEDATDLQQDLLTALELAEPAAPRAAVCEFVESGS
ncbi:methionine-gamma-lyase [Burkholderiaceae bacterium]|nr:methionine-gamma-lyase [Burkholderiaceae bacterium]